jgi:diguanylate cyclase (GGDEF)-like protein
VDGTVGNEKQSSSIVAGIVVAGFVIVAAANHFLAGNVFLFLIVLVLAAAGVAGLLILIVRNLIARHRRQVEEVAMTHELTGVPNRRGFAAISNQLFRSVERRKVPLSLLIFDIDELKRVNDSYGHQGGDAVIRDIVSVVSQRFRKSDLIFRWDGGEFLVLAPECNIEEAERLAESVRAAIVEYETPYNGRHIVATASFGVAEMREGESEGELITRADHALYAAKKAGNNRVEIAE